MFELTEERERDTPEDTRVILPHTILASVRCECKGLASAAQDVYFSSTVANQNYFDTTLSLFLLPARPGKKRTCSKLYCRFRALPFRTLGMQMHLSLHLKRHGGLQLQLRRLRACIVLLADHFRPM